MIIDYANPVVTSKCSMTKWNVAGSNPVSPTKTVRNKGVSVGLKTFSDFRYKRCKHGTTSLTSVL